MPYGIDDDLISWGGFKDGQEPSEVKYPYGKYIIQIIHDHCHCVFYPPIQVVHAEANAIMHKTCIDLKGCTLYATLFPCNECAKLIIQSGIKKVYFLEGEPLSLADVKDEEEKIKAAKKDKLYTIASHHLFEMAGYTVVLDTSQVLKDEPEK